MRTCRAARRSGWRPPCCSCACASPAATPTTCCRQGGGDATDFGSMNLHESLRLLVFCCCIWAICRRLTSTHLLMTSNPGEAPCLAAATTTICPTRCADHSAMPRCRCSLCTRCRQTGRLMARPGRTCPACCRTPRALLSPASPKTSSGAVPAPPLLPFTAKAVATH